MKNCLLLFLFSLVSCAGYVNNVHRQIDREDKVGRREPRQERERPTTAQNYWRDRFRPEADKRPIKNPLTYSAGSGPAGGQMAPPVKREYRPQRYKANDFKDEGGNDGSLWANQGSSSSLFTYQNDKRSGDIVIINVLENLRNQISAELKRTFPDKPKKKKKEDGKDGKAKVAAVAPPVAAAAADEIDMKVYDKISGTVMEEISQDYILVRGQKEVIFKKEKRSIEVQALVSRKDIMENDYVNSDKLLESRVFILRDRQ